MGRDTSSEDPTIRASAALIATDVSTRVSVGLEEGRDGAVWVHALSVPGCAVSGGNADEALAAFPDALADWLDFLAASGAAVPSFEEELEIAVDEWIRSDAEVSSGESHACFEADLLPLSGAEIEQGLQRLGDLRGQLLPYVRRLPDAELDRPRAAGWTIRRVLDELARAQWWTLTRLGASPLAEVPERTVGRLDTAMALVVQQFTTLPPEARENVLELDGELWTPRKALRRLLWLEWSLGRAALDLLGTVADQR